MPSPFSVIPGSHPRQFIWVLEQLRHKTDEILHPISTVFVNGTEASYWRVSVAQKLKGYLALLVLLRRRASLVLLLSLATKPFPTFQKSTETTYDL